jgi:hypothetical protein
MPSESAQILNLLADRRIDVDEAERLLALVGGRDRFVTLAFCAIGVALAVSANLQPIHLDERLAAALRSFAGSAAFHQLQTYCIRMLGELP